MKIVRFVASVTWLLLCFCQIGQAEPAQTDSFQLTSPVDNAKWSVASKHWVTWQTGSIDSKERVTLEFSTDAGKSWSRIARLRNYGKYLWTVPDIVSNTCLLRLSSTAQKAVTHQISFSIIPSQVVADYEWEKVNLKAPFAGRDGAGALVYKNKMWFIGGWNPRDKVHFPLICNNEVWSSADGIDWTLEKPNTFLNKNFDPTSDWEGRHTAGYAVYKNKMWIIGGDCNQGHYQNDVWNSSDGKSWKLVNENVPWGPRALHHTFVFRDKIWIMSGQTMPAFAKAEENFYRDLWNTTDGVHWQQVKLEEPCWSPRGMIGGNVIFKDRIWILGGGTYNTPTTRKRNYYNDVWSSADGRHWTQHVASAPWNVRLYHDVASFDGRMWVLEGHSKSNRKDVWYSADGVNWYELPNTPWAPRHAASVYVHDNALWMIAGNNMKPDVWKLQRTSRSENSR